MARLGVNLLFVAGVLIFVDTAASQEAEEPQHFCGRKLAEALALLCENQNNFEKRVLSYNAVLNYELPRHKSPWLSRRRARALDVIPRGKRQYVVEECCNKACYSQELMGYC